MASFTDSTLRGYESAPHLPDAIITADKRINGEESYFGSEQLIWSWRGHPFKHAGKHWDLLPLGHCWQLFTMRLLGTLNCLCICVVIWGSFIGYGHSFPILGHDYVRLASETVPLSVFLEAELYTVQNGPVINAERPSWIWPDNSCHPSMLIHGTAHFNTFSLIHIQMLCRVAALIWSTVDPILRLWGHLLSWTSQTSTLSSYSGHDPLQG